MINTYGADCSQNENFLNIDKNCIQKFEDKFTEVIIPISSIKAGDVYFYKTDLGNLGKIFIHSTEKVGNSCNLYVDYETFDQKGSTTKSSTFGIKNYLGVWDQHSINLDQVGNINDFTLRKHPETKKCSLETLGASVYKVKKSFITKENSNTLLYFAAILLIGFAVFNISKTIFEEEDQFKSSEILESSDIESEAKNKTGNSFILKFSKPFYKRYFVPIVSGMKKKKDIQEKYKKAIAAAGLTKSLSAVDFYSFKLFLIIGFPVLYLIFREFLETSWPLGFSPIMGVLGFIYPDIWLKSRADNRKKEILNNLPFVVDMLALSVEAGLDFVAAMTRVLQKAPKSPLVEEFDLVVKEIQIGATRSQALKKLSWRVDDLAITSFCATLIAADSVGASIGPILKSLSGELRIKRSTMIEKKGASAASKMLIPMIVFILPAILLIIFAPMVIQFVG